MVVSGLELVNLCETRKWNTQFHRKISNGKTGLPFKKFHFFWKFSSGTNRKIMFHLQPDRNFRNLLVNGKHPWSRATEKEKRSPVQAPSFRLVRKPETKPANERIETERNETKRNFHVHLGEVMGLVSLRWFLFRFFMAQLSCPLNDAVKRATDCS